MLWTGFDTGLRPYSTSDLTRIETHIILRQANGNIAHLHARRLVVALIELRNQVENVLPTGLFGHGYASSRMVTLPVSPSTRISIPVLMVVVPKPVPTTAGRPYSRDTMAA